jgi:hypothetical protein
VEYSVASNGRARGRDGQSSRWLNLTQLPDGQASGSIGRRRSSAAEGFDRMESRTARWRKRIAEVSRQTITQVTVAVLTAVILALGAFLLKALLFSSSGHVARRPAVATTTAAVTLTGPAISNAATPPATSSQSTRKAYAITFAVIGRGVEDMLNCHEKLMPYATGPGTRVSFSDLKLLSATLTTKQLAAVEEASTELDRLFPLGYTAPPSGTNAAYHAWKLDHRLRSRAARANELLRAAMKALGGRESHPDICYGKRRKARLSET